MINKNKLEQYGFEKRIELEGVVSLVCTVFGNGSNNNADIMMMETANTETHLGDFPDYNRKIGESPYQFDEGTFEDTIRRTRPRDKITTMRYFKIDLNKVHYGDLHANLLLSSILCRLKYKLVPEPFPATLNERYDYYKLNWNSSAKNAKGTKEHYIELNKNLFSK